MKSEHWDKLENEAMYGCDPTEYLRSVISSAEYKTMVAPKGRSAAFAFAALKVLTTAQEDLESGNGIEAYQAVNRAMYLLKQIEGVQG